MQFSTKQYDEKTGLSYYGYRFYNPALRRWLTRDPIGERGGINLYGFVGNNPVNWIDPFGLAGEPSGNEYIPPGGDPPPGYEQNGRNWWNPDTKETISPDYNNPKHGDHCDYKQRGGLCYRVFPDGHRVLGCYNQEK